MRRYGEGIQDYRDYILHYKGETPGLYGVGFLIKKKLAHRIEEIKGISERITVLNIVLPLNKNEKWSIIQAYSPTESNKNEDVVKTEKFYEDLRTTIAYSHKNIILMDDFNGQIGTCNNGEEYTVGKYGHGKRSKNGDRLVTLALENKLRILNSFYKKKKTKQWTWIAPNGQHKNEIDFIMSNNAKMFQDVSIIHNLNFYSDHKMVPARLTSTLTKRKRMFHNESSPSVYIFYGDQLKTILEEPIEKNKGNSVPIQEKYEKFINTLQKETKKVNPRSKSVVSDETKKLLHARKELLQKKGNIINRDYNKAFDSLEHDYIREALRSQGVQEKYICILINIYSKSTAQIRLETTGEEFPIEKGVRQGDPVSPKLFSAALEMIFRNLDWNKNGLNINGENLNHLRFADDLILFSECPIKLEQMLQKFSNQKWYPRDGKRNKGRPIKRWEDDIKGVAGPEWTRIARDRDRWKSLEEAFLERQADHRGNQLYLGINHSGILTFQGSRKTHHFKWSEVHKINFEGRMFIVHLNYPEKKHTVGFKCPSGASCRHVWCCAIEQMLFFTLSSSADACVYSGGGLFSWGTKFKYVGRTEREILERDGLLPPRSDPHHQTESAGPLGHVSSIEIGDSQREQCLENTAGGEEGSSGGGKRKASSVPATPSTPLTSDFGYSSLPRSTHSAPLGECNGGCLLSGPAVDIALCSDHALALSPLQPLPEEAKLRTTPVMGGETEPASEYSFRESFEHSSSESQLAGAAAGAAGGEAARAEDWSRPSSVEHTPHTALLTLSAHGPATITASVSAPAHQHRRFSLVRTFVPSFLFVCLSLLLATVLVFEIDWPPARCSQKKTGNGFLALPLLWPSQRIL
ncbi:FERM domain-containing protein 5 [Eumeta japonica]|uniref:FERM domain-containing protein 5 n=1 Tax=Eumeta variegata TaxID=151549 RepID=A0A4C1SBL4_EUMVA|nr:FERM domain-containing protein 5 [Eumeta japonica]